MERKVHLSELEQAKERTRQALGSQAMICECCGQKVPPTSIREDGHVPAEAEKHPRTEQVRRPNVNAEKNLRNTPAFQLADKANRAEKKARVMADVSVYRALSRRLSDSESS